MNPVVSPIRRGNAFIVVVILIAIVAATGIAVMAMMPAMVMTVEMTNASRGRRMNSDEIVMIYCFCVEAEGGATLGLTVMPGRTRC